MGENKIRGAIHKVHSTPAQAPAGKTGKKQAMWNGHTVKAGFKDAPRELSKLFNRTLSSTKQPRADLRERVISTTVAPERKLAKATARATGQAVKAGKPILRGRVASKARVTPKLANVNRSKPLVVRGKPAKLTEKRVATRGFRVLSGMLRSARRAFEW